MLQCNFLHQLLIGMARLHVGSEVSNMGQIQFRLTSDFI